MTPGRRFRFPFRRTWELRRDIEDELAHHRSMVAAERRHPGRVGDSASLDGLQRFDEQGLGGRLFLMDFAAELETRTMTTIRSFAADFSFALRLTRRHASTSVLIVLTLATGIGTATTMLNAVDTILLQPIPVEEPDEVMTLWRVPEASDKLGTVAPGTVADWRERSKTLVHVAGAEPYSLGYDDGSGPRSVGTWRVTEGFFDILKARPRAGRLLVEDDYLDGSEPVVVVGHDFWISRLGADLGSVGRSLIFDGTPHRIVGVLPREFPYAEGRELYVPRLLTGSWRQNRSADYYLAYGRLAPNATRVQADTELREIARATAAEFPASDEGLSAAVVPMGSSLVEEVRPGLLLLLLAAMLILVIACVNAGSLMLAEAARRSRELAIRAAVGAGRSRIMRQILTESAFLAALAGALGLVIAIGGSAAFRRYGPDGLPRLNELSIDVPLIVIGGIVAATVAVIVSLPSALRVLSTDLHAALKPGGRGGLQSPNATRLRALLVGVQVVLAVVMLAGGGLLTRSWLQVTRTDQGYSADGVVAVVGHIWSHRRTPEERLAFANELAGLLEAVPGVRATVASSLPLSAAIGNDEATVRKPAEASPMSAMAVIAGRDFFPMLGIAVHEGHGIDATVLSDGEPVAVISQSLRDRIWPSGMALGEMLEVGYNGVTLERRVIGVVADVRYRSLEQAAAPTVYLPFSQVTTGALYFMIVHTDDASEAGSVLESTIRLMEPSLALEPAISLQAQARAAGKARRFSAMILAVFAAISALLTGVGLFGLMAHTVRTTSRELAVHLAVGAWPTRLRSMILRRAARLVAIGTSVGLVAFLLLSDALRGVLYGVAARDPMTLGAVVLAIGGISLLAAWVPAHMATRIDPALALRSE